MDISYPQPYVHTHVIDELAQLVWLASLHAQREAVDLTNTDSRNDVQHGDAGSLACS
jgi:hypothetical protein